MGAIVNGLTLHGLRAFGAGFFIFSDYMKASLRLAAIMRIPSTFVFTHDSIGVGEDGPTHQPIEQLAALRATPNLNVVRPAGFNETALAWRFALEGDRDARPRSRSQPPGRPDVGPGGRARRRDRARRLRAGRLRRRAGPDPDGLGHRGPHRQRRAQAARGGGRQGAAGEHAVPGPLRRAGPGVPRQRAAAVGAAPACPSRRPRRSAGTAGWATLGDVVGDGELRRLAPRPARSTSTSASPARTSPTAPAPCCSSRADGAVQRRSASAAAPVQRRGELNHERVQRLGRGVEALRGRGELTGGGGRLLGRGGHLLGRRRGGLGERGQLDHQAAAVLACCAASRLEPRDRVDAIGDLAGAWPRCPRTRRG